MSRLEEMNRKGEISSDTSEKVDVPPTRDCLNRSSSSTTVEHKCSKEKMPLSPDQENVSITSQLNLDLEAPVMKTPIKIGGNKRPLSSASPSVSSPSSEASLKSSKTAPSPAKRWKQALVDGVIATVQPNPIAEMEEILNPPKVCLTY